MGLMGISGWVPDLDEGWHTALLGAAFVLQAISYSLKDAEWLTWVIMALAAVAIFLQFRNWRRRRAAMQSSSLAQ
jgi:1,4-dihydroxy-2-naphthoate octaprenyltransferase